MDKQDDLIAKVEAFDFSGYLDEIEDHFEQEGMKLLLIPAEVS